MANEVMMEVEREVLGWPGIAKEPGRFGSTAYLLGRREIGHVHSDGVADLPFPRAEHDEAIAAGRAFPHRAGVAGYVSLRLRGEADARQAIALFRRNYERATAAAERRRDRRLSPRAVRRGVDGGASP